MNHLKDILSGITFAFLTQERINNTHLMFLICRNQTAFTTVVFKFLYTAIKCQTRITSVGIEMDIMYVIIKVI